MNHCLKELKEINDELAYRNKTLSILVDNLKQEVKEARDKLDILIKQSDEWAKSYDKLLNDFVSYRNKTQL